jgi:photosystem II stability/assembly factor-like uncharacterized protein
MKFLPPALAFSVVLGVPMLAHAQTLDPLVTATMNLSWRNIGPAIMGGRIDDIEVHPTDSRTVYIATAAGGIFKTTNHGTTFTALFQNEVTGSIGDIALAPSAPETLYVGTGEPNNRQSSSWGHGMYRSTDGGTSFEYIGLKETHHIGRVRVHPTDASTVYVAALGELWKANPERGVYKTTDGGKTWERSLFIDEDTGVTDIVMDPTDPNVLVAAAYQRRRTPFGFAGGGPGSGLYKTTDGGKTWKKLTEGLPTGVMGRIGLDIYKKNPKVMLATIETTNGGSTQNPQGNGGIWKTTDGGESWKQISDYNPRPMYFSQVRIDPGNESRVYLLGVRVYVSDDGGRSFTAGFSQTHADGHALWIDPANSNHLIYGCDGGVQWSWDRGRTWDYDNQLVVSQPYEVAYDFARPYNVYIGLQDNGSWGAPSQGLGRGITNDEWINVGGGDGFHCAVDPTDPNIVYSESQGGGLRRTSRATGESRSIRPSAPRGERPLRFDWNTPIVISPHNPKKLLVGANRLCISEDRGDTWRLTQDLTNGIDRDRLPIFGGPTTRTTLSRYDGEEGFSELTTVAESPARAGILWAGADDGALSVSKDDGKTWTRVEGNVSGLPKGTYVSRVVPSRFSEGRCYVSFDGHRTGDFTPYVFVTEDFGATWQKISGALPQGETVSVVREHPSAEKLLFVGTERGLWVSITRGERWRKIEEPLPTVPVDDIQIHPRDNDLILATHGRGVYILDDIGHLVALANRLKDGEAVISKPRPAVHWRLANLKGTTGSKIYIAPNPSQGATVAFWIPKTPSDASKVSLAIRDGKGRTIRTLPVSDPHAGWNRVSWDLRRSLNTGTPDPQPAPGGGGPGGFSFRARGPRAQPGVYALELDVEGQKLVSSVEVVDDPRLPLLERERRSLYATQDRAAALYERATALRLDLEAHRDRIKATDDARKPIIELLARLVPQSNAGGRQRPGGGEGQTPPPPPAVLTRLTQLIQRLDSFAEAPSKTRLTELAEIEKDLRAVEKDAKRISPPR